MKIKRTSILTGKTRIRELPVTVEQMVKFRLNQENIQQTFPQLSSNDREFILTGITEEEWDEIFKEIKE